MNDERKQVNVLEQKTVAKAVFSFLKNKFKELQFEDAKEKGRTLCLFTEAGGGVTEEFVAGGYLAEQLFSVILKIDAEDTKSRLDALSDLDEICNFLEQCNAENKLPEISAVNISNHFEITDIPHLTSRDETSYVYQFYFALNYEHMD